MKNMLGRSENASNVVANNEENALNRIKPATWREGDMQLGKGSSSMLAERYQREKTPVDVKRNYSELKVSKICSDASSSDMKGAKKKESEINVLISKVMQDAKKRVPVSREVNIQGTSPEIPEGSLKKRTVSPSIIAMDLLYSYNFGVAGNQLYIYEEKYGYWKMIQASAENRDLRALIKENDKAYVNKSALSEIYEWIRIDAEVLDTGEQGKYYLNFRDCAVNWRTEECVMDRKNLHFDYYLDLDYMELNNYQNGEMKKFLKDVFGEDKDTKREFGKFFGLCLSSIRTLKICGFLYGPSNTGKSVTLNLLKLLVGEQWSASVSFSQLSNEFAITRLLGKRINLTGEVSGTSNRRLDTFKSLTGNDDIEICYKGKDYFSFSNKCLLVFACNSFPQIQDIPEFQSFLSRVVMFPYNNPKPRSEWVGNLEKELLGDAKAVIKFAMEGLRKLESDDFQIYETQAMEDCKKEFVEIYDSFSVFADKYLEEDPDSKITSKEIELSYKAFCQEESRMALNINIWGQILKQRFICRQCTVMKTDAFGVKKRIRGYQGIRFKDVAEIES